MGSILRDWQGFHQFPAATQSKLVELFAKLKEEGVNKMTILVMGKGGVGKSSTVNSLLGERAVNVSSFQSEGFRPVMVSRDRAGFTLNIIDTPGLVEGGYVNYQALELIKRFLLNKTITVLLYVDRLDAYRVDDLDKQIISAITDTFGKEIWNKSLLVLTHAQLSPPDDLSYDVFCARRSEAVLKTIRMGAQIRKRDFEDSAIPVGLVENSGRCNKNENDEKILPNGDAWIPSMVKEIVGVATNGKKSLLVDEKLVNGSESNDRGKIFIPLILGVQWLLVKWIQREIKKDIVKGGNQQLKLFAIFRRRLRVFSRTGGGRRNHWVGNGGPEQGRRAGRATGSAGLVVGLAGDFYNVTVHGCCQACSRQSAPSHDPYNKILLKR
ncbi:GTPASE IMAP FAMILY MEMBER-RELATED [Salix viminalis]|uniref:GTPASE IMAP FAMILY MEMBER-RELATED n=1 Tax=Salix viminalis TaxID=40686 RepID=A0A9Q0SFH1_SALVM|nr:GTPASE IMAP FAMILY MEMBER-RELATED [Salix viminalis]